MRAILPGIMASVVFVAPFLLPTTVEFVASAASVSGLRVGLLTQHSATKLPAALRDRLAGFLRTQNAFDAETLAVDARRLGQRIGGLDALLGPLEQLQVPLAQARQSLGLPGIGVETAKNFREKARMKSILREHRLPCARHCLARSTTEGLAFAHEVGFPIVVKPPAGAGAQGTFRVENLAELEAALRVAGPGPGQDVLLEEFVTGDEHSFETAVIRGKPVWTSFSRYLPTPLEALENPWIQWCVLLPREREDPRFEDIRQINADALAALQLDTGFTHLEWFRRRDGRIAISEVAARPPGAQITTLLSQAHGVDFRQLWVRLMVFGEFDPPPRRYAAGAAFFRGQGPGKVKTMRGLEQAQKELGSLVVEARLPQPGQPKASSYEGEGYAILRHPDTEVVRKGLHRLVSLVRVEMSR